MSLKPTNLQDLNQLPICTRTVVIDMLFMKKYSLTKTQTLVFYYLTQLKYWARVVDGFYVILSKKIEQDLDLHKKTVEATLTRLKKLGLIETQRVLVPDWNNSKTFRAIRVSEKGKEYNTSFHREREFELARDLKEKNKTLQLKSQELLDKNMKLEEQVKQLQEAIKIEEFRRGMKDNMIESCNLIREKNEELEEKFGRLQIENRRLKRELKEKKSQNCEKTQKPQNTSSPKSKRTKETKEESIDRFRERITRRHSRSGKPICNAVFNSDDWLVDTEFYINSYSRLSMYLPSGELNQITDPKQIDNFWTWLFANKHRVGNLVDVKKKADVSELTQFIGESIILENKRFEVLDIVARVGGATIVLIDKNGKSTTINNGFNSNTLEIDKCKEIFELFVVKKE